MSHFIDWQELEEKEKEAARKQREIQNNGRTWGGYRIRAGRPPKKRSLEGLTIALKLNTIQELSLKEMGNGDIQRGVQALVDKYL